MKEEAGDIASKLSQLVVESVSIRSTNEIFGIIWGYVFGWIMNVWVWAVFIYPLTLKTFIVTQLNSVWFDTFHAIGNAIFLGLFGTKTIGILERFKKRFNWVYS